MKDEITETLRAVNDNIRNGGNSTFIIVHRDDLEKLLKAATPSNEGWRDIESAPVDTPVRVKAGSMTFLARLAPNASMTTEGTDCDQWQAEIEGEHPPCWSGGACWAVNEDDEISLQPTQWMSADPRSPEGES